jgi:TRAP-type C4-dicarboxylate transport system permease small subunit
LFSASKVLALIAGVNGAIAGTLIFKGGYDAATNTPDLDVAPAGAIQQGWTYVVAGAFYRRCRGRRFNYLETKCAYYFSTH